METFSVYSIFCQFCRSINYSINGYHRQHIVVMAEVVSVALELSSGEVELKPSAGLLADSGNCYLQLCKEKGSKNAYFIQQMCIRC